MGLVYTGRLHHTVSEAAGNRNDRDARAMGPSERIPQRNFEGLSDRENEVLNLAAEGATDKETARLLKISTATVGTYWARMRAKLGVGGRTAIVARVLRAHHMEESLGAMGEADRHRQIAMRARHTEGRDLARAVQALADLECAPVPLIGLDCFGRIEFWNYAASRALGYAADDVMGKTFPGNPTSVQDRLVAMGNRATMPSGTSRDRERLRTKDGKTIDAILHFAARWLGPDRCVGLIVAVEAANSATTAAVRLPDPSPPIEKP